MELRRWIKTEMRWKRKVSSQSSPETVEIFRPRSARKEQPASSNGPKIPPQVAGKCILSRPWYLTVLRTTPALAADPAALDFIIIIIFL